jgi:hypothetical protein
LHTCNNVTDLLLWKAVVQTKVMAISVT